MSQIIESTLFKLCERHHLSHNFYPDPVCMIHIWPVSKLFGLPVCWFPREVGSVCDKCTEGRVLLQYASNSSSPRPCDPSGHWSPREAEGIV